MLKNQFNKYMVITTIKKAVLFSLAVYAGFFVFNYANAAITFDSSAISSGANDTGKTFSFTNTDGNLLIVQNWNNSGTTGVNDTVTYGGDSMTLLQDQPHQTIWYLFNPKTGTNNIITHFTASYGNQIIAASYKGVKTSEFPENIFTKINQSGNPSLTTTSTENDSWAIATFSAATSPAINSTQRQQDEAYSGMGFYDSGTGTSTGSINLGATNRGSNWDGTIFTFAPTTTSTPTSTEATSTAETGFWNYTNYMLDIVMIGGISMGIKMFLLC